MRKLPDMTYDFIRGESYRMSRSGNYDREKHNHDASEKTKEAARKIAEYIREHGPIRTVDGIKITGEPLSTNLKGYLGFKYNAWEDEGYIGLLD